MTRPYAEVIGDPIGHSKSPLIHNFWLQKLGIDAEYRACHVCADELESYFAQRRRDAEWRGCNVTIPHKEATIPVLDDATSDARTIGAVNTVRSAGTRLFGRNSDVHGIWRALDGVEKAGRRVALIGAGGAARAAAFAISRYAFAHVTIMNRSIERAETLVRKFNLPATVLPIGPMPPVDLVINATSLGMAGQPALQISLDALPRTAVVFDMVYNPLNTSLLEQARARQLETIDGLTMLLEQAREAFAVFFGRPPPRDCDAELRALLTA